MFRKPEQSLQMYILVLEWWNLRCSIKMGSTRFNLINRVFLGCLFQVTRIISLRLECTSWSYKTNFIWYKFWTTETFRAQRQLCKIHFFVFYSNKIATSCHLMVIYLNIFEYYLKAIASIVIPKRFGACCIRNRVTSRRPTVVCINVTDCNEMVTNDRWIDRNAIKLYDCLESGLTLNASQISLVIEVFRVAEEIIF